MMVLYWLIDNDSNNKTIQFKNKVKMKQNYKLWPSNIRIIILEYT